MYKDKPFHIGTVRFTNKTYQENLEWKDRKNHKGCIYGLDTKVTNSINKGSYIFVIEMNNYKNKIMGIGLIKNITIPMNRSRIYEEEVYNQYVYKGKNHITRENLLEIDKDMILFLENMLFRGAHHFKRGNGCTILTSDRISQAEYYNRPIQKRVYRCNICGKIKKGHICPGKRVKLVPLEKKCKICFQVKKGHICTGIKKNLILLNIVLKFFSNIF